MKLIHCVVLATHLINLVVGEKLNLTQELEFSKDLSACSNLPRCCPSGMSNSGKCIIRNKTSNETNQLKIDSNFTCKFDRIVLGFFTSDKLSISRHGYLLLTEKDDVTNKDVTTAFTTFCCNEIEHFVVNKVIAFVCAEKPDALFTIYINPALKVISGIFLFQFFLIYLASSWRKTYPIIAYTLMTAIEYILIGLNTWWNNGQSKQDPETLIDNLTDYVMLSSHCFFLLMVVLWMYHIWIVGIHKHTNLICGLTIAFEIFFIIVLVMVLKKSGIEKVINIVVSTVMCIILLFFVVGAIFIMVRRQKIQQDDLILEYFAIFIIIATNFGFSGMITWISTLDSLLGPVDFILLNKKIKYITKQ